VRLGVLLLLASCDRLFGIDGVKAFDAGPVEASIEAGPPPPAILVQQTMLSDPGTAEIQISLTKMPTSGNVLVMIGGARNGVTGVSGAGVATWKIAASSVISPTSYIWFGVTDGTSATAKLQTGFAGEMWAVLTEWKGLATASTVDTNTHIGATNPGAGTAPLTVTTLSAPDVLVFAMSSFNSVFDQPLPWAELPAASANSISQRAWYSLVNAPGTQTVQYTYAGDYDATFAALRTAP
jgi:hypothetical protein